MWNVEASHGSGWMLVHSTTMDSTSEEENNDFNFGRKFEFSAGPSGGNVQQLDNWPGA